jgi:hypothetical protein
MCQLIIIVVIYVLSQREYEVDISIEVGHLLFWGKCTWECGTLSFRYINLMKTFFTEVDSKSDTQIVREINQLLLRINLESPRTQMAMKELGISRMQC